MKNTIRDSLQITGLSGLDGANSGKAAKAQTFQLLKLLHPENTHFLITAYLKIRMYDSQIVTTKYATE